MKLEPLMEMHADLKDPVEVGHGPLRNPHHLRRHRRHFSGKRLRGQLVASGGDWILIDDEGVGRLDVRIDSRDRRTEHSSTSSTTASSSSNETVATGAMEQRPSPPSSATGSLLRRSLVSRPATERYAWLNKRRWLSARVECCSGAVEYRIFEAV